ncbi:MAG TPA: hypothetical protein VFV66_17010, partial [Nonomuraea sp.]|nr:hypothetical protein [Nonomuraea sp.]
APPESAPETVAAARTLVRYLREAGVVPEERAARMRERLDDIAPRMSDALADPANFGMAKSLFSSIGPESLEQSIAIPSGELPDLGADLGEAPCDCPGCTPLPAARLAAPDDLRAALRTVPMLAEQPLPGQDDPLREWAQAVDRVLGHDTQGAVTGSAELDEGLYDLFDMLYRLQVKVPVTVIGDYLDDLAGATEADLAAVLDRLAWHGLLRVEGDDAELTPLAVWALREHYLSLGLDAPQAPDLAEADAHGLIEGLLEGVPAELAEDDINRWLHGRAPGAAAGELLAAAAGAPAVARGIAITIVDRLDAAAEPQIRHYLDDQELRPHMIHWLAARGLPAPQLTQEELLWVSVDMLALALPAAEEDPEIFAENMAASGPPAHLIEEMWRVDHPDVVDVLELLGRSIPDGTVAKAARKAAFKARSRAIR